MFLKFPKFLLASLIIAAIIVFILIYFPIPQHWAFESKAELERIRMELPVAETRWKSHNITDYDIDVQVFIHMGMCSTNFNGTPTTLNVRQGRLVVTDEIRKYSLEEGCKIGDLLPPKLFDSVRQILEKAEPDYQYLQSK